MLPDFFFRKSIFLKLLSALCTDFVRIFLLVDIRSLFSVHLLPKVPTVLKNALNKNYIELNFLQKTGVGSCLYLLKEWSKKVSGRLSLSPQGVEQGGIKDLSILK